MLTKFLFDNHFERQLFNLLINYLKDNYPGPNLPSKYILKKTPIDFHLFYQIIYDRGESFSFDFEPNEFLFGSKSNEKLLLRSYSIKF